MAGELNGTLVIIEDSVGEIVGQGELAITYGGTPIDISNKSYQDWITLLDDELAAKQVVATGTFVYNSDAQYKLLRTNSWAGTHGTYTINFGATGETLTGIFFGKVDSDAAPHGDKVTSAVTFSSSGVVTRTEPT